MAEANREEERTLESWSSPAEPTVGSGQRVSFLQVFTDLAGQYWFRTIHMMDTDDGSENMLSPSPSSSRLSLSAEDIARKERCLMRTACYEFLHTCVKNGTVDPRIAESHRITPYSWVKFREQIMKDGKLQMGHNTILIKREGILFKCSNMKPVCSQPSCYSTDFSPHTLNRRCIEHEGDKTSFEVLEILFREVVLGRTVAVGMEHVNLMFSHGTNDSELQLRNRILDEYFGTGLSQDTWWGLHRIKFKRAAHQFRMTDSIIVRRHWTFDNAEEASNHYYKVAVAAELVAKKLNSYHVVPGGEFKGLIFQTVKIPNTVALEGEAFTNTGKRLAICEEINVEQVVNYGVMDAIQVTFLETRPSRALDIECTDV